MNAQILKASIFAALLVVLAVGTLSWLRLLPTHAEEARAHAEAVRGLIDSLQTSLPPIDPILEASTRVGAWSQQAPSGGKVSIEAGELRDTVKQLDAARQAVASTRASWTAMAAQAKIHTAKLETLLGDTVWPDQLGGLLRACRELLLLLGWPLALVIALAYIRHSDKAKDWFGAIAKSIHKVAYKGVEVTLWGEEFRQSQSDTFAKFRADVQAEYDKLAERHAIERTLNLILKGTIEPELKRIRKESVDYRATIHVRDALFKNAYYQLVDYLPTGGNRGRAWSVRYGMVGRAWRLEKDSVNRQVGTSEDLIEHWGMTSDESQGQARQSMMCCILKTSAGTPIGAFYMDAKDKDAFGTTDEMHALVDKVQQAAKAKDLIKSLEAIWETIKTKAPLVEVYGNRS